MATKTYRIKHNDAVQVMTVYLTNDDGTVIAVDECTEIKFHCGMTEEVAIIDASMTVVNGPLGIVSYTWTAVDTAHDPGEYNAEVQMKWGGGRIKTSPTKLGESKVIIYDEVA